MTTPSGLAKAIELCGSQAALAERIGVTQQVISFWLTKSRLGVAAEYVIPIERATDGAVSRHALRPDIYPAEEPPSLTSILVQTSHLGNT